MTMTNDFLSFQNVAMKELFPFRCLLGL